MLYFEPIYVNILIFANTLIMRCSQIHYYSYYSFKGLCKKKLENQESLSRHLDSHKSFTRCEICQETFLQWQALLAHRLQHVKSRKYQKCHICLKPQRSSLFFEYHYLSMHSDKDVSYYLFFKIRQS